jgi:hypothetical protein
MVRRIKSLCYDFFYGIKNLFVWFKIIWNDRQWDYIFLLELLKFKLALMEKEFRNYGHHLNSNKDAYNMHIACLVLDRLLKEAYYENAMLNYGFQYKYSKETMLDLYHCGDKVKQNDFEFLLNILKKQLFSWWD